MPFYLRYVPAQRTDILPERGNLRLLSFGQLVERLAVAREVSFEYLFTAGTIGGVDALRARRCAAMYIKLRDLSFLAGRLVHHVKTVGVAMLNCAVVPNFSKGKSGAELQVLAKRYAIARVFPLNYWRIFVPTRRNQPLIEWSLASLRCGLP